MALGDVFQKTPGGAAELSARTVKLAPLTRIALVMIDGVKPVSDLAEKLGGAGPAEAAVNELLGHHFVAQVSGAAPAPAAANDAAAPVTPAMGFEALRKWAAKHLSGAMGPMGDDYCMRMNVRRRRRFWIPPPNWRAMRSAVTPRVPRAMPSGLTIWPIAAAEHGSTSWCGASARAHQGRVVNAAATMRASMERIISPEKKMIALVDSSR